MYKTQCSKCILYRNQGTGYMMHRNQYTQCMLCRTRWTEYLMLELSTLDIQYVEFSARNLYWIDLITLIFRDCLVQDTHEATVLLSSHKIKALYCDGLVATVNLQPIFTCKNNVDTTVNILLLQRPRPENDGLSLIVFEPRSGNGGCFHHQSQGTEREPSGQCVCMRLGIVTLGISKDIHSLFELLSYEVKRGVC